MTENHILRIFLRLLYRERQDYREKFQKESPLNTEKCIKRGEKNDIRTGCRTGEEEG